jgi:hypothetical protein
VKTQRNNVSWQPGENIGNRSQLSAAWRIIIEGENIIISRKRRNLAKEEIETAAKMKISQPKSSGMAAAAASYAAMKRKCQPCQLWQWRKTQWQ